MKLKERFTLLRAGYTKADIEDMIAAEAEEAEDKESEAEEAEDKESEAEEPEEPEELTKAKNEIENLKKQLEELQKHNINNSSQKEPTKDTSEEVWNSFFGNNRKDDNK